MRDWPPNPAELPLFVSWLTLGVTVAPLFCAATSCAVSSRRKKSGVKPTEPVREFASALDRPQIKPFDVQETLSRVPNKVSS